MEEYTFPDVIFVILHRISTCLHSPGVKRPWNTVDNIIIVRGNSENRFLSTVNITCDSNVTNVANTR